MQSAEKLLLWLLESSPTSYAAWQGKDFEKVKLMAMTEKGNLGEDFLKEALSQCGYSEVEQLPGRRGHFDVSVTSGGQTLKFEVKVATQDVHGNFQFNGIRTDKRYTHLFCLGVAPSEVRYLIVEKSELVTDKYPLVPMASSTNAAFKLTRKLTQLRSFESFEAEVRGCLNGKRP